MDAVMQRVCMRVVEQCARVVPGEMCLILTDSCSELSSGLQKAVAQAQGTALTLQVPKETYAPGPVPHAMEKFLADTALVLLCTEDFFPHAARRAAAEAGSRVLSLGKVTDDMARRSLDVDYDWLSRVTCAAANRLRETRDVVITTVAGTDLHVQTAGQPVTYFDGLARGRGCVSVLPAGVVAVLPVPGTAQGTVVLDGSIGPLGLLASAVRLTVVDGIVTEITGGQEAQQLQRLLDSSDRNAFCLAEVGMGTNPSARYVGRMVEDERVCGSAHVGLGGNVQLGGTIASAVHIDATMRSPCVSFDGHDIVRDGHLLLR